MKVKLEFQKPRNLVAKDLRTPKYRVRIELDRRKRDEKHKKKLLENVYV